MHTIHNIPGSQYLEYVDPGNVLLVLYSFVFTGSRVDDTTPKQDEHGFFPACFSVHDRYRCRYRRYFGLIVPKRFWFRYPTLVSALLPLSNFSDRVGTRGIY